MAGASTARKLKNYGGAAARRKVSSAGARRKAAGYSRGRSYYYGSSAAAPAHVPAPVRRRQPGVKPAAKPAVRPRRSREPQLKRGGAAPSVQERRQQMASVARLLVTVAVAAAMVFVVGVRYSSLSAYGYELVGMKARLEQLKDTRDAYHVEVGRLDTALRVEETATFLLGMDRPMETRQTPVSRLQASPGDYPVGRSARVALPEPAEGIGETSMPTLDGPLVERISDWFDAWLAGVGAEASPRID